MRRVKQKPAPPPTENGWTTQQLALALLLFGVIAVVWVIKSLLLGPPPYSVLAYFIGPCLIGASYLVDPCALGDLLHACLISPKPPAAKGE